MRHEQLFTDGPPSILEVLEKTEEGMFGPAKSIVAQVRLMIDPNCQGWHMDPAMASAFVLGSRALIRQAKTEFEMNLIPFTLIQTVNSLLAASERCA